MIQLKSHSPSTSQITGRQPVRWEDFVVKHRKVFAY